MDKCKCRQFECRQETDRLRVRRNARDVFSGHTDTIRECPINRQKHDEWREKCECSTYGKTFIIDETQY